MTNTTCETHATHTQYAINSLTAAFAQGKAFIPFLTCGDPDMETSREVVLALAQSGASLIELGIPFSDPTAEGPVIQAANERSLAGGTTTDSVFELVKQLRTETDIPLAFMTYANVVFHYGIERFCERAEQLGVGGLILPDVPFEERDEFVPACTAHNIDLVSLVAPTSQERIGRIARTAQGFVYCISSLGVTGMRSSITTDLDAIVAHIRRETNIPIAIGFGISGPKQAQEMAAKADGVIVGSAIVKIIAEHGRDAAPHVAAFARSIKEAL